MKKLITIFGPSECSVGDPPYDRAYELGGLLGGAGFAIVTGGYDGVMEAASKGAHEAGGRTIGVTANVFHNRGRIVNDYVKKELRVSSANDQLMELISLADAYVACGISPGTLVEIASVWDFLIKKFVEPKPFILLGDEWQPLYDSLVSQPSYLDKTHFVTLVSRTAQAFDVIFAAFGPQEMLPELTVINN